MRTLRTSRTLAGLAAVGLVAALLAACTSTKAGSGTAAPTTTPTSSTAASTTASTSAAASTTATTSAAPSITVHPAPAQPLRTATVHAPDGTTYVIKIWVDVKNTTCADHAYGPMVQFLTTHKCDGMGRRLATTTVNGQDVGFNVMSTSFPGTAANPYAGTEAFRAYVEKEGTGSINDLLREGYRLPSGPTSVPSPDAFATVGQDAGVSVYDMWFLSGPTPENDPSLIKMAQNIFLQY